MSVAYEDTSPTVLVSDLETRILEYLREKKSAPADEVVSAIKKQQRFLTPSPIVTAIWNLNSKSQITVDGDWNVSLRDLPLKSR